MVTDLNCQQLAVNTVEQALSVIEETPPDMIVIDVTLRITNGAYICRTMREHVFFPILLLTPINNETHTLEAYQAFVDEFAIKPLDYVPGESVYVIGAGFTPGDYVLVANGPNGGDLADAIAKPGRKSGGFNIQKCKAGV